MKLPRNCLTQAGLVLLFAGGLASCSVTPYKHESLERFDLRQRAEAQQEDHITVRAAVPGASEAERIFGIPLQKRQIQAVWLEIRNTSDDRVRFAPYSVDNDYFTPHEVAYMYRKRFSKQGWSDMETFFYESTIPRFVEAHSTVSGFVFTNAQIGTKAFNVDIYATNGSRDLKHFTFFINVPDFTPDHAEVDFRSLYAESEVRHVDMDGLRREINQLPCCTVSRDGSGRGQPIEIILVGSGINLLQALLRAGWTETSYQRNESYLSQSDYLYGRTPDAVFRKGRDKTTERNELAIWLTPILKEGVPVWVAQVKHAIGRHYKIGEQFLGVRLDPDINDGRNYMLQDMWYSQSLKSYSWSDSGLKVEKSTPQLDFNNNAWFSDGFRLVLRISGEPVGLDETVRIPWDAVVYTKEELP